MTATIDTTLALRLEGLHVTYPGRAGRRDAVTAVDGLSLSVPAGQTVAIVGESGSGKSTTLHALLGLLPARAQISFRGLEIRDPDDTGRGRSQQVGDLRQLRGYAGLIPQDPARALDPLMRIGAHFGELHRHLVGVSDREHSRALSIQALDAVGIDRPEARLTQYPHELSGGQRQRILIALALVTRPRLLLADEPTSNLDTTVQRRVLDLLDELRATQGLSVLLVTHDIAVAAERASHLIVVRHGTVIESGPTAHVINTPTDPYTRELLDALPSRLPARPLRPARIDVPVLEATDLAKTFAGRRGTDPVAALEGLSLRLHRGRTLALVGESGAGKSTALRLLTGLDTPDRGAVTVDGRPVAAAGRRGGLFPNGLQMVYQNPKRSLNPSLPVAAAIAEPLEAARIGTRTTRLARARELLAAVGLPPEFATRRPYELSGGQAQRVAIARALAPEPDVIVLDEPVSALDQSVQFQILTLLLDLQARTGVAYVFVSHDLGVVRAIADDVIVLHRGHVVDHGPTDTVFQTPTSPHTRALLDAIPTTPAPAVTLTERTA